MSRYIEGMWNKPINFECSAVQDHWSSRPLLYQTTKMMLGFVLPTNQINLCQYDGTLREHCEMNRFTFKPAMGGCQVIQDQKITQFHKLCFINPRKTQQWCSDQPNKFMSIQRYTKGELCNEPINIQAWWVEASWSKITEVHKLCFIEMLQLSFVLPTTKINLCQYAGTSRMYSGINRSTFNPDGRLPGVQDHWHSRHLYYRFVGTMVIWISSSRSTK